MTCRTCHTLNACTFNRDQSPERIHDQGPERICSQDLEPSCSQHFCGQGTATRIMCDQGSAAKVMCVQALNLGRLERNLQSLDLLVINQQLVLLAWARSVWTYGVFGLGGIRVHDIVRSGSRRGGTLYAIHSHTAFSTPIRLTRLRARSGLDGTSAFRPSPHRSAEHHRSPLHPVTQGLKPRHQPIRSPQFSTWRDGDGYTQNRVLPYHSMPALRTCGCDAHQA
jgi:hypothetical protein